MSGSNYIGRARTYMEICRCVSVHNAISYGLPSGTNQIAHTYVVVRLQYFLKISASFLKPRMLQQYS